MVGQVRREEQIELAKGERSRFAQLIARPESHVTEPVNLGQGRNPRFGAGQVGRVRAVVALRRVIR